MTLDTYELRWFFDKPPGWFDEAAGEVASRTDFYAPLKSELSSVKWREGLLELKRRVGSSRLDGWPVESWSKISVSLTSIERELVRSPPPDWLAVYKRRQTEEVQGASSDAKLAALGKSQSVQIEWTELRLCSIYYWSFAIESPRVLGPRSVINALSARLTRSAMSDLPRTNTAYPVWLAARLPSP